MALILDPDIIRGRKLGNLVLLASDNPLPVDELSKRTASDTYSCEVMHDQDLSDFQGDAEPVTDAEVGS